MNNNLVVTLTVDDFIFIIAEQIQKKLSENIPPPPEELLSPKDVCRFLGISLTTLATYTDQGKLIALRIGKRKVLYKKSEIMAALVTLKKYKPNKAA